jgi:hypothetical protein
VSAPQLSEKFHIALRRADSTGGVADVSLGRRMKITNREMSSNIAVDSGKEIIFVGGVIKYLRVRLGTRGFRGVAGEIMSPVMSGARRKGVYRIELRWRALFRTISMRWQIYCGARVVISSPALHTNEKDAEIEAEDSIAWLLWGGDDPDSL